MSRTPQAQTITLLDAMVANASTPGVQYGFATRDALVFEHVAGVANAGDAAGGNPVTADTTFNAYSIAKVLTSAAVLSLAGEGRISLDAPIAHAARMPELEGYGTVRETLLHCAGFPNPYPLRWVHDAAEHACFDEARFALSVLTQHARAVPARRGHGCAYSNVGYLALGEAIAEASGIRPAEFVNARMIESLRLAPAETLGFRIPDPNRHARGHVRRRRLLALLLPLLMGRRNIVDRVALQWHVLKLHYLNGVAYGGLMANARGLLRLGQAVLGRHGVWPQPVRDAMTAVVQGVRPARSLAWYAGGLDGTPWYAHAGGGLGYYAELRVYPQAGCVSAILLNRPGLRDVRLLDTIDMPLLEAHRVA